MNLESIMATIASLLGIYSFVKNDTSLFSLFKKTVFGKNLTH